MAASAPEVTMNIARRNLLIRILQLTSGRRPVVRPRRGERRQPGCGLRVRTVG